MADLTATSWSVGATGVVILNKQKTSQITLTLASGNAGVYPLSGGVGIPLPTTPGPYGFVRNLDYIIFYDEANSVATQANFRYSFVASGPGVKIWTMAATAYTAGAGFAQMASGIAPASADALVIKGTAYGW